MNRSVAHLNLFGIIVLVCLCVAQWLHESRLQRQLLDMETANQKQLEDLQSDEATIAANHEDLENLRTRCAAATTLADQLTSKLKAVTADRDAANAAQNQTKALIETLNKNLANWKAAVQVRDAALVKTQTTIVQLTTDRNAAITRLNSQTDQLNAAASDLKEAADTIHTLITQRDDAIQRFNNLAAKYNALLIPSTTPRSAPNSLPPN
jgi:chromosome segregation ATPase